MSLAKKKKATKPGKPGKPAVTVPCGTCEGTGQQELPKSLSVTLTKVRDANGKGITPSGADLARSLKVRNTAMCQRMKLLEKFGLVTGEKVGRRMLWTAVIG